MTETEIIHSILSGNTSAFKLLVDKYHKMVFRTAMGFVHNKEDAEDLTQDVFIRIFQSLGNFREQAALSTWIYRITVNLSLNYVNANKIERFFELTEEKILNIFNRRDDSRNPEQRMIDEERDQAIRNAIDKLSDKQRTAFILSKYEELSQKEIAAVMQTTEGAVEQHLQRAKASLQKKISSLVGE